MNRVPQRAFLFALLTFLSACDDAPLPTLTAVPPFALVDQQGAAFESETALGGHVWVANFIFTRCPSICPLLTTQMANLVNRLDASELRFVSFSVEPEYDTPPRLQEYAERHDATDPRWSFLTGEIELVRQAITEGLRMRMGTRDEQTGDIMHGSHFVLVDRHGRIRGFYRSDGEGLESLERDAQRLLDE